MLNEQKPFDLEVFDIKLETELIGRNFFYFDECDSTNEILLRGMEGTGQNGTVVLAEKQNQGRGRQERQWFSAKGQNLLFSILLTGEDILTANMNAINLGTSLALAQIIETLYQVKTDLKWPNDVLVGGKKIAGILLESIIQGEKLSRLVVGIGLNVNQPHFSGNYSIEPTSIRLELRKLIERERTLAEFLNLFEEMLDTAILKPQEIFTEWKNRCGMMGESIIIQAGGKEKDGVFDDIDEEGFLILRRRDGRKEKIHYGDVVYCRA